MEHKLKKEIKQQNENIINKNIGNISIYTFNNDINELRNEIKTLSYENQTLKKN